jgi:hypothetical protein
MEEYKEGLEDDF